MEENKAPENNPPNPQADPLPPQKLALSCIRHLRATCRRYRTVLDKIHTDYYLCPEPTPPSREDLQWLANAQLRLWDITISTILFSSSPQMHKCKAFIKALGRASALQTLIQRLICGPPEMRDGTGDWEVKNPAKAWLEVYGELPEKKEEDCWWVESLAVVHVREEYKQKLRILKEKLERERSAHVKTKKRALQGELKYLETIAERYREIARLRDRYEYEHEHDETEENCTDSDSSSVEEENLEENATSGLGLPRGTKRRLEDETLPCAEEFAQARQIPVPEWRRLLSPSRDELYIIINWLTRRSREEAQEGQSRTLLHQPD